LSLISATTLSVSGITTVKAAPGAVMLTVGGYPSSSFLQAVQNSTGTTSSIKAC